MIYRTAIFSAACVALLGATGAPATAYTAATAHAGPALAAGAVHAPILLASLTASAAGSPAASSSQAPTRQAPSAQQAPEYLRTTTRTTLRNFPDGNGSVLTTLPAGTLLKGYGRSTGRPVFREVQVATGFPVWVYGQFLQPTASADVMMVTAARVNMRPSPELSEGAMPIRSKLDVGQRVRVVRRAEKSAKLSEDWVQVIAPADTKAWVVLEATTETDAVQAATEWARLSVAPPVTTTRASSKAGTNAGGAATQGAVTGPVVAPELLTALAEADRAFEAASALRSPTPEAWRDVVAGYEAVVAGAPEGSVTRSNAETRLTDANMRLTLASLREDLNSASTRHDDQIKELDRYLEGAKQRRTVLWGRFEERGWLESRNIGGVKRWYLVFGGATVAEVRCLTQRYDFEVFEGFELGVIGHEIAPVVRSTQNSEAQARVIDVQRIEVISGRDTRP